MASGLLLYCSDATIDNFVPTSTQAQTTLHSMVEFEKICLQKSDLNFT